MFDRLAYNQSLMNSGVNPRDTAEYKAISWSGKQVYGAIQNIDYGILWLAGKNGFLIDDPAEINAYSNRFNRQWKTSAKLIINNGINNNPIRKIITYIVTEYAKRKPVETIGKVIKGLSAKSLKMLATSLTISK
ncbi:hypothetical protein IBE59_09730, partial [Francisella philomiragia]